MDVIKISFLSLRVAFNLVPISGMVVSLVTGCTSYDKDAANKSVFRYNESANITSLDPAFARDQANIWAVHQIFNGLVQLNSKLEIEPCIAKSWVISNDGKKYTFSLRSDVFFHDNKIFQNGLGRKVIANDFVYSLQRIADKKTASPGSWVFNYVKRIHDTCSLQAPNDTTFIIELNEPFPPFLGLLTTMYCSAVPWEAITAFGPDFRKNPVGTGAFRFQMWKEGVKLVLLKNPRYFEFDGNQRLPYLDAIAISFLSDKQSAFLEFMKGRLDFMSGIDVSYKDELLTRAGILKPQHHSEIQLLMQPYLNTEYFGFVVESGKGSSVSEVKEIRQAINFALDRKKMVEYLRNNIGIPGLAGIVPRGLPSFDTNVVFYDYDPQKARQLLEKSGYGKGKSAPSITLSTTSDYLDIAKYLQHQVEEIGMKINIEVVPPAALKEMKAQAKLPFFRASWIADYPDAENYLSLFYSPNFSPVGPNYTHYSNPTFDSLYMVAMSTVDDSLRYLLYRKMEKTLMEDAPVVILYYDEVLRFVHHNIDGLEGDPMNLLTLKRVIKRNNK